MQTADSLGKRLILWKTQQEEQAVAEDEMVREHYWLNDYGFEQTLGDSKGQGSQACWVHGLTKSQTGLSEWTTML